MKATVLPALDPGFRLDIEILTRASMHRVYWDSANPLTPRRTDPAGIRPGSRYDCPAGVADPFGVLYLGFDLDTCWMETVVRGSVVRPAGTGILIPEAALTRRWACEVTASEPLVLARFADTALVHLGESASNIMADSYLRTQAWAHLLHAHALPQVDGLLYRSRFMSDRFCIALFDRAIEARGLRVHHQRSFHPATSAEAQAIMRRYNVVPT